MFLTVDLASKFSAASLGDGREVILEFDSRGLSPIMFAAKCVQVATKNNAILVVEDVPLNDKFTQAMTKSVFRLQGFFILLGRNLEGRLFFLNPSTWQAGYPGVGGGWKEVPVEGLVDGKPQKPKKVRLTPEERIENARLAALALGYEPPDLVAEYAASLPEGQRVLKKHTNPLAKNMTDYIDAFLMNRWCHRFTLEELAAHSGVQPPMI